MYTLKSIAQRGTLFGAAAALVVAAIVPAASVFADALNPLTKRSLLLSSSAPGYQDTDGSGNSTAKPSAGTPGTYAPAGSGPNGMKTGETFTFNVSSDSTQTGNELKAMTFQYCTGAAGKCQAPGDNSGDSRTPADLRKTNAAALASHDNTSDLDANYTSPAEGADFDVYLNGSSTPTTGWTMDVANLEDQDYANADRPGLTGKNNYITLKNSAGIQPQFNDQIKVVFKASETNHITNPGSGSFFVKINTYKDDTNVTPENIIDGGVTVANVMTDSIHITTKVLETMSFSVGTRNRDTVKVDCTPVGVDTGCEGTNAVHGTCDPIQQVKANQLQLGDPMSEYSLATDKAYDVYSYWRLSSNSSGGASVYYSGDTLANTVGDVIAPIGPTKHSSTPGTEQFGLAFVDASADTFDPTLSAQFGTGNYKTPSLYALGSGVLSNYADGTGSIAAGASSAAFAFVASSSKVPELLAQNSNSVISCDTAKMRYIANIGADTPAGVYTTKINYLAAPQY